VKDAHPPMRIWRLMLEAFCGRATRRLEEAGSFARVCESVSVRWEMGHPRPADEAMIPCMSL
jgi:hypothetical protein